MNEQTRENLSALMDGELPRQNLTGLIEELSTDQDLQYLWNRYHIIGDAIRGEGLDRERASIAEQVRLKLADEPVVLAPASTIGTPAWRWAKPVAGIAIAASIAVLAVLVAPGLLSPGPETGAGTMIADQGPPPPAAILYVERPGTRWNLNKPAVESKLDKYLVNHQEYDPADGMTGMLPYARFVGYDSTR